MANDSPTDINDFAAMSAALTGFRLSFIQPQLDPVNLSQLYFDTATEQTNGKAFTLQMLLTAYRGMSTQPAQQVANNLLGIGAGSNQLTFPLAQSIIKLWYTGGWYEPGSINMSFVVSSGAYTNGLVWNVMQSHPMGSSLFTFGYWSEAPGSLFDFGLDVPQPPAGGAQ